MKVSIIVSVYNGEKFVSRAIRSCIEQSMPREDYEIIVVNDGSSDKTKFVLESFGDWIKVISLERNMGLPSACNIGLKSALGRYVIRVDADDYVHRDLIKVGNMFLGLNPYIDAVAFDYHIVSDLDDRVQRVCARDNPIACGIMFKKDDLVDIGLYDETFLLSEDEDLRIRFLKKYSITYIPLPLYRYHMHQDNSTKNNKESEKYKKKLKEKHGL